MPWSEKNKKVYAKFFYNKNKYSKNLKEPFDSEIVEKIKSQEETIHDRRFNRVNSGFILSEKETEKQVFSKLEKLLYKIMDTQ